MSNNRNYNRNRNENIDNNHQSDSPVHGGELKKGRLSQFKNHNPMEEDIPNEYIAPGSQHDFEEE